MYIHFVNQLLRAHVHEMKICDQDNLGIWIIEPCLDSEVTNIIELNFFLVVFDQEAFGNKARG